MLNFRRRCTGLSGHAPGTYDSVCDCDHFYSPLIEFSQYRHLSNELSVSCTLLSSSPDAPKRPMYQEQTRVRRGNDKGVEDVVLGWLRWHDRTKHLRASIWLQKAFVSRGWLSGSMVSSNEVWPIANCMIDESTSLRSCSIRQSTVSRESWDSFGEC